MQIDCDSCAVRGLACGDCVVSVLLGNPGMPERSADDAPPAVSATSSGPPLDLSQEEHRALGVLAAAGMVPHLRLVPRVTAEVRRAG